MNWWKSPTWGPAIHGGLVWLVTDGLPVLQYLQGQLTGDTVHFDANRFWLGLAAAFVTALISASRNQGAVSLTTAAGQIVKGVQDDGGQTVMAQARDVVPTNENVIVLRGTGDPMPAPVTSPPAVSPPPDADRPYDSREGP